MIKAYMSHPIRGPLKEKATAVDMRQNNDAANLIAERIRLYMAANYSSVNFELYVPAEHDAFVNRAWKYEMLTVGQILYIDCKIIEEQYNDLLLVFAPFGPPVEGCATEVDHALLHGITVLTFEDLIEFKDKIEPYMEAKGIYE